FGPHHLRLVLNSLFACLYILSYIFYFYFHFAACDFYARNNCLAKSMTRIKLHAVLRQLSRNVFGTNAYRSQQQNATGVSLDDIVSSRLRSFSFCSLEICFPSLVRIVCKLPSDACDR